VLRTALTNRSSESPLHSDPPSAALRSVDSAQLGRSAGTKQKNRPRRTLGAERYVSDIEGENESQRLFHSW